MFDPTDAYEMWVLYRVQLVQEHRNIRPGGFLCCFLSSKAFSNPSFSAAAEWDEDPSEIRPMFSFTSLIVFGSLEFEIRRSHCISIIFSWLNEHVSPTLISRWRIRIGPIPSGDPGENLVNDVVQSHFTFDVCESSIAQGLDFELGMGC